MIICKITIDLLEKKHITKIELRKSYPFCGLSVGEEVDIEELLKENSDGIYIDTHGGALYLDESFLEYYNIHTGEGIFLYLVWEFFDPVLNIHLFRVENTFSNPKKYIGALHKLKKNAIAEAKNLNNIDLKN